MATRKNPISATARTGSRTVKRSVTFSMDVDSRAHELVGDRGFSAFVNDATRAALNLMGTNQIIEEYEAQHGVITDTEVQRARAALQKARKMRK